MNEIFSRRIVAGRLNRREETIINECKNALLHLFHD